MKKNYLNWLLLGIGGILLYSSFKKKGTVGAMFVGQTNAPTGTSQVYSNVGTKIYDQNANVIFVYDTANLGMTVTGQKGNMYSVVIGADFANGIAGFVNKEDVKSI